MKKTCIALIVIILIGCGQVTISKYGQGGINAAQYVREQASENREDIESLETTSEDSLLTDRMLSFGQVQFAKSGADFWQDKISRDQYQQIIDSTAQALQDVQNSWLYGIVVNDSLRKLKKYEYNWAKVYTVTIKMKSGVENEVRILMDNDGITPRMTEKQFSQELQEYTDKIIEAQRDIYRK